jgi:hypothetical protein
MSIFWIFIVAIIIIAGISTILDLLLLIFPNLFKGRKYISVNNKFRIKEMDNKFYIQTKILFWYKTLLDYSRELSLSAIEAGIWYDPLEFDSETSCMEYIKDLME